MSAYGVQPALDLVLKHRHLSHRTIAHLIGVEPNTLYAALTGEIPPTEHMPERLSLILDAPAEALFTPSSLAAMTTARPNQAGLTHDSLRVATEALNALTTSRPVIR